MIRMIRHRGPDQSGVYIDHQAALGHARLSIIDLAGGQQPMSNEDNTLHIVFNGEIYNYLELREGLIQKGHRFTTRSDTEVILHLFEDAGEACVSDLNGQWAFAIWDSRRNRLFLSRDRYGVRPLFYTSLNGSFIFASEIKALFAYPGVSRELDLQALAQVFTLWHTLPPRTAFRKVHELPPGMSAVVESGGITLKRHWTMSYPRPEDLRGGLDRERDHADQLLALLTDACRLRLRSDVPVGAYLSGGLDSTLIAALVRRHSDRRLRTFSIRFDDGEFDEGRYQREAVHHLRTDHTEVRCSTEDIGRVFPAVVWHTERPILRTAAAPLFLLSRLVHDNGYKVVITGEGSDELFGGYDIFKEVKVRQFCSLDPTSRLRPLLFKRLYPYLPGIQGQPASYLCEFFGARESDKGDPCLSHRPRWRTTALLKTFFSNSVKAELGRYSAQDEFRELLPPEYGGWDAFTRAEYLETSYLLPGYILSSQGDRVAMAHSVEARFPFLDHRVAAFAAALPHQLKMRVLEEKYLLRRCSAGLVPNAVLTRRKQPYRAPDAASFVGPHAPDYVRELLSPDRLERSGLFHPDAVGKLMKRAYQGELAGAPGNMAVVGILSTMLLDHHFCERFPAGGQTRDDQ